MHVARVLWRSNYGLFVLASRSRGDDEEVSVDNKSVNGDSVEEETCFEKKYLVRGARRI
jgi:hypothetical protein